MPWINLHCSNKGLNSMLLIKSQQDSQLMQQQNCLLCSSISNLHCASFLYKENYSSIILQGYHWHHTIYLMIFSFLILAGPYSINSYHHFNHLRARKKLWASMVKCLLMDYVRFKLFFMQDLIQIHFNTVFHFFENQRDFQLPLSCQPLPQNDLG